MTNRSQKYTSETNRSIKTDISFLYILDDKYYAKRYDKTNRLKLEIIWQTNRSKNLYIYTYIYNSGVVFLRDSSLKYFDNIHDIISYNRLPKRRTSQFVS